MAAGDADAFRERGVTWKLGPIADAAWFDRRDVERVSASTAYTMMTAVDTGRIYKRTESGRTWD